MWHKDINHTIHHQQHANDTCNSYQLIIFFQCFKVQLIWTYESKVMVKTKLFQQCYNDKWLPQMTTDCHHSQIQKKHVFKHDNRFLLCAIDFHRYVSLKVSVFSLLREFINFHTLDLNLSKILTFKNTFIQFYQNIQNQQLN